MNVRRKEFLERAVVELVYNIDEKSTANVRKGESTAKVPFKLLGGHIYIYIHTYIHINGHQPRSHNPLFAHACAG